MQSFKKCSDNEMKFQLDTNDTACNWKLNLPDHNALEVIRGSFSVF